MFRRVYEMWGLFEVEPFSGIRRLFRAWGLSTPRKVWRLSPDCEELGHSKDGPQG